MTQISTSIDSFYRNLSGLSSQENVSRTNAFGEDQVASGGETTNTQPSFSRLATQRYELAARVEQQRSFDLELVTQDGDVVSISFDLASVLDFRERSAQASIASRSPLTSVAVSERLFGAELNLSHLQSFDIRVNGELDESELQALQALFTELADLSQLFFEGDTASAQKLAAGFQLDTNEFAAIDFELQSRQAYSAQETYQGIQNINAASVGQLVPSSESSKGLSAADLLARAESRIEAFSARRGVAFSEQSFNDLLVLFLNSVESAIDRTLEINRESQSQDYSPHSPTNNNPANDAAPQDGLAVEPATEDIEE